MYSINCDVRIVKFEIERNGLELNAKPVIIIEEDVCQIWKRRGVIWRDIKQTVADPQFRRRMEGHRRDLDGYVASVRTETTEQTLRQELSSRR